MKKLSTGADSTLGAYLALTMAVMGEGPATKYLEKKIAESPRGEEEEVIADERQMIHLLATIQFKVEP